MGGGPNCSLPCTHDVVLGWQDTEILHSANTSRLHWGLPWVLSDLLVWSCWGLPIVSGCCLTAVRNSLLHAFMLAVRVMLPAPAVLWEKHPKVTWVHCYSHLKFCLSRHAPLQLSLILSSPFIYRCPLWNLCLYSRLTPLWSSSPTDIWYSWQRYSVATPPRFLRRWLLSLSEMVGGWLCSLISSGKASSI